MKTVDERACCVLGGCGFLGSLAAIQLVAAGYRVRVFDREGVSEKRLAAALSRVELVRGDLMNASDVAPAIDGFGTILHFAGTTVPQTSMADVSYDLGTNVVPLVHLLERLRQAGGQRLIYASSGGTVYGLASSRQPIDETHPTDPICAYGVTKLMAEKYIQLYGANYGVNYAILRLANPYGSSQPWDRVQGAVAVFMHRLLLDQEIAIWGDGQTVRDYVHESDVAAASVAAVQSRGACGVFNVGSGLAVSLLDLLRLLAAVSGRQPRVRHAAPRGFDVPYNVLDWRRFAAATGWRPAVDLRQGVARMWERACAAASG